MSGRAETLRLSDLSSGSSYRHSSSRRKQSPQQHGGKRVTISNDDEVFHYGDSLERLEAHNIRLSKENELLKEQLKLKEDALRLHGIQIMSDVIHLLDNHHIECRRHRANDISPMRTGRNRSPRSPQLSTRHNVQRRSESPYEGNLRNQHRLLEQTTRRNALNNTLRETVLSEYKPRCDTQRSTGVRRSPSLDSMELEDILEKSTAGFTNSPKHKSTPYKSYKRSPSHKSQRDKGDNCNVNAYHLSPRCVQTGYSDTSHTSDSDSLNLQSKDGTRSSYFTSHCDKHLQNQPKQKGQLLTHWEACENSHLHVAPRKPPERKTTGATNTKGSTLSKGLKPSKVDLNRTYTIAQDGHKVIYTNGKTSKPCPKTITAGRQKPPDKPKHLVTSYTPKQSTFKTESPSKADKNTPISQAIGEGSDLDKLSLLESNHARVLGEIAFQLDKRILSFVLNGKFNRECRYKSFYGYNVVNLQQRIIERETGEIKEVMLDRYTFLMRTLHSLGYVVPHHGNFASMLVNKHGVMKQGKAESRQINIKVADEGLMRDIVDQVAPQQERQDILILLQCLAVMAADDGMPLFIW